MRHFTANYILPVSGPPIKDGIVSVDGEGEIVGIYDHQSAGLITEPLEQYEGIIVPGFINCHCHLELSHLLGQVPRGKGLVPFISSVMSQRFIDEDTIMSAMEKADKVMYENGIVAVGDISNKSHSRIIKENSPVYYHTFIELLGFDPEKAEPIFNKAMELKNEFAPLPASLAPHAPYSVSQDLFSLLKKCADANDGISTMHNQESDEENNLYRNKSGAFIEFYERFKIDINYFKSRSLSSLQSLLPWFSARQRWLLVHNTYTSPEDLQFANRFKGDIYWCFCPKANLYIEGILPEIELFLSLSSNITLGTDSLASNDSLCILAELKAIKEQFSLLPLSQTIAWATLNGAKFLGIDKNFGSIEKGKRPGLNLISNVNGQELTAFSQVTKLI